MPRKGAALFKDKANRSPIEAINPYRLVRHQTRRTVRGYCTRLIEPAPSGSGSKALCQNSFAGRAELAINGKMLKRLVILVAVTMLACSASCGTRNDSAGALEPEQARSGVPRGAVIEASGYATIMDAPPAPFTPFEPGEPPKLSPEQLAASAQFARVSAFQNQVREEVEALGAKLRVVEKGNFVSVYYDNEGDPSVVFQFLRDGPGTLRKYSSNPRFFGKTVRFSREELMVAADFMWATFREDRVLQSTGIGRNEVEARITVSREEFLALVKRKGVAIPPSVDLVFNAAPVVPLVAPQRPTISDPAVPPHIARLLRIFPRDNRGGPLLSLLVESRAKVVLKDGCFRIAGGEHNNALVLFPIGAQLFVDRDGYLAYGQDESPGYARVGEELVFQGLIGDVSTPELVQPVHNACGAGRVVKINGMQSAAAGRAQSTATQNLDALRSFRDSYGLSESVARRVLEACEARTGMGVCLLAPPLPPPPGEPLSCPAGSKPSLGLCRTPEGYIRPIPEWIQDLIRD